MKSEFERFNTDRPELCPSLRWEGQFILADPDPTVPASNEGLFWCLHTQTCIGQDGKIVGPGKCSATRRTGHGTGGCGQPGLIDWVGGEDRREVPNASVKEGW